MIKRNPCSSTREKLCAKAPMTLVYAWLDIKEQNNIELSDRKRYLKNKLQVSWTFSQTNNSQPLHLIFKSKYQMVRSTSSSFRNPEACHIARSYQGKKCGCFQRVIIACIWDSCNGVEEGSCLFLSSGMLKGYTGWLSGCTSGSWWSNRERWCINENMAIFWGLGHLNFTVQEGGGSIGGGEKGGPCAVGNGHDLVVLAWQARRACVNKY